MLDPALTPQTEDLGRSIFNLEDIAEKLRDYRNKIEIDERLLEDVEDRLDVLHKLKRKYGGSFEAIFAHLESINLELSNIANLTEKKD